MRNIICIFLHTWECHDRAPVQFLAYGMISENDFNLFNSIYSVWVRILFKATVQFKSLRIIYVAILTLLELIKEALLNNRQTHIAIFLVDLVLKFLTFSLFDMPNFDEYMLYYYLRHFLKFYRYIWSMNFRQNALRKRLRIRSVSSVNYHYITVLCPFNLLIRFKCCNTVLNKFQQIWISIF